MMASTTESEYINVTWNAQSFSCTVRSAFTNMLEQKVLVDVTLSTTDNVKVDCHRLILSACSPFFAGLVASNSSPDLIIVLAGVTGWQLHALVSFMYRGHVDNITRDQFRELYEVAKSLQIKGLLVYDHESRESSSPEVLEVGTRAGVPHPQAGTSAGLLSNEGGAQKRKAYLPMDRSSRKKVLRDSEKDVNVVVGIAEKTAVEQVKSEELRAGVDEEVKESSGNADKEATDASAAGSSVETGEKQRSQESIEGAAGGEISAKEKIPKTLATRSRPKAKGSPKKTPFKVHQSNAALVEVSEASSSSRPIIFDRFERRQDAEASSLLPLPRSRSQPSPSPSLLREQLSPPEAVGLAQAPTGLPAPGDTMNELYLRLTYASSLMVMGYSISQAASMYGISESVLIEYLNWCTSNYSQQRQQQQQVVSNNGVSIRNRNRGRASQAAGSVVDAAQVAERMGEQVDGRNMMQNVNVYVLPK